MYCISTAEPGKCAQPAPFVLFRCMHRQPNKYLIVSLSAIVVSLSSKDAPVGAVRSAVAWVRARNLRAGRSPRVKSIRPEGFFKRGEHPGHRDQLACGTLSFSSKDALGGCRRRLFVRGSARVGAGELHLLRSVVLSRCSIRARPSLQHTAACQSARAWNAWPRAWLCGS